MKPIRKFKYAIVAMATVVVAGCALDPLSDIETEVAENPDYEIIRSLGLSTEGIVETDDLYIVEGDIVFDKSSMQDYVGKTRQRYMSLIEPSKVSDIKVYINPELQINQGGGPTWYQAAVDALPEWSGIDNCLIHFTQVMSETEADICVIRNQAIVGDAIARASYPSGGMPGWRLYIGDNYDRYTAAQKKYTIIHELGHNLGYVHMDEPTNGSQIPDTPTSDPQSVMASTKVGGRSWNDSGFTEKYDGFTPGDIRAAQATYGIIWSLEIDGPATCQAQSSTAYTLNLGTNLTLNYSVSWYVNNVLKQNGPSLSFNTTFPTPGQYTVKAEIIYGTTSYYSTKTITADFPMYEPGPSITGRATGSFVSFWVTDPVDGATYEWEIGHNSLPSGRKLTIFDGPEVAFDMNEGLIRPFGLPAGVVTARCRLDNSDWSNTVKLNY